MNYIITTILSLYILFSSSFNVPFKDVEAAFVSGDAAKIVNMGTQKILISIEGKEGIYSKSQGTQVMSSFFKGNPPKSFKFSFKGKEENNASFAVGNYQSKDNFRVSIKFKKEDSNYRIESITIVKAP